MARATLLLTLSALALSGLPRSARAQRPLPPPAPLPVVEHRPSMRGPLTLGVVAAGSVALGATFWVVSKREPNSPDDEQRYETIGRIGLITMATGALAGAGAITWWLLLRDADDPTPADRTAWITPTANGLLVGASF